MVATRFCASFIVPSAFTFRGGGSNPSTFFVTTLPRRSLTFYLWIIRHHFRENWAFNYDAGWPSIHACRTKKWLKTWFCVQIKCKWSFLTFLIIKLWLLSILFAEFVKRSARFDGKIVRLDSKSGNINITAKNVEAGGFIHPPPWPLRVTKVVCTCACSCNITLNL